MPVVTHNTDAKFLGNFGTLNNNANRNIVEGSWGTFGSGDAREGTIEAITATGNEANPAASNPGDMMVDVNDGGGDGINGQVVQYARDVQVTFTTTDGGSFTSTMYVV